jgi:tricorn protease
MRTESRAVVVFALLGVFLAVVGWLLARALPTGGVAALPTVSPPTSERPPTAHPPVAAGEAPKRLMLAPSLSKDRIAFSFAGELWTVARDGGQAERLVTGQLQNYRPIFSPDGSMIAFTGVLDGNADVYVVPASGGEARRLTYYPGLDAPVGWTPDGKRILYRSMRDTPRDLPRLFTIAIQGGASEELPLPSGNDGDYSPDGKRIAYLPHLLWENAWKKYRGGQATPVWIADLDTSKIVKIPRPDSNDSRPMWIGDTIYFLSDRNGPTTLFAYDVKADRVRELVPNPDGLELRSASAGPGAIVYEQLGEIHLYDLATGKTKLVPIAIDADLPQVRPRFEHVAPDHVLHAAVSPTGKRILFEARGDILAVPADKGDVRNLTRSPGVADRDPAWSPDGKWVAWLSDRTGEYALVFRSPDGLGPERRVDLGEPGTFWYSPRWSPDSKKVVLQDKRLNLWLIDIDHPTPVKIDTYPYEGGWFDATWSPDSRWVGYAKVLENFRHAIFVYSVEDKSIHQVTDGRSDSGSPRFDRGGKYLWFLASTDQGPTAFGEMAGMGRPVTSSVYGAVLAKDVASPVAPESDEEGGDAGAPGGKGGKEAKGEKKDKGEAKAAEAVRIDFDGIGQRIVTLPIDRANYQDLQVAGEGVLLLLAAPVALSDEDYVELEYDRRPPLNVTRFELKTRKTKPFVDAIDQSAESLQTLVVTADGNKVLYEKDHKWFLVGTDEAPKEPEALKTGGLEVWVDPRAEWRQMYHETWRIERDFLYDKNAHGLDLAAAEKVYAPFLDGLASRNDLNVLLAEALGNIVLGHTRARGGAGPQQEPVSVGLLGADYTVEDGRYRFSRILAGESWNPGLKAPLTQPGIDVKEGDFLISVNGQDVKADEEVYRPFLGRAGKQTVIRVAPKADGSGARSVTVVPVGNEYALRLRTWMEDCRKKVDQLSGGRVGYVYVPDTFAGGFENFNRYYFSQTGKEAVVIDERFNHGGDIADYIINALKWTPLMGATTREGNDIVLPVGGIFGPKVMIANQMSGSGGDALPWMFKNAKLGPLVGVRTWGGLVGIGGYPPLIDGGMVTAPRWALYGLHGEWEVENHGIAPDVEVEQDPALVREGHDPQLEKAVQLALDALAKTPTPKLVRPKYPDYGPRLPKIQ